MKMTWEKIPTSSVLHVYTRKAEGVKARYADEEKTLYSATTVDSNSKNARGLIADRRPLLDVNPRHALADRAEDIRGDRAEQPCNIGRILLRRSR